MINRWGNCDDIQSFNTIIWSCGHLYGALFRYFSLAIIVFSFYLKTCLLSVLRVLNIVYWDKTWLIITITTNLIGYQQPARSSLSILEFKIISGNVISFEWTGSHSFRRGRVRFGVLSRLKVYKFVLYLYCHFRFRCTGWHYLYWAWITTPLLYMFEANLYQKSSR